MTTFLLDSNVFAELTRARPNRGVLRAIDRYSGRLVTATTVLHEIWFGILRLPRSRRRDELENFMTNTVTTLPALPYDEGAAKWHAAERARLEVVGRRTPFADGQIAAVAAVNDATLVTSNTKDFESFVGLTVTSWWRAG